MEEVDLCSETAGPRRSSRSGPRRAPFQGPWPGSRRSHRKYGRLPWADLLAPAVELARGGVELTQAQAHMHAFLDPILRFTEAGRRIYGEGATRPVAGKRLALLRPGGHARGDRPARGAPRSTRATGRGRSSPPFETAAERVTLSDLASYRVVWRRPVRTQFRGPRVASNPPPSSGGLLIAYGLALLERLGGKPRERRGGTALVEVMSEQGRARGAGFSRGLQRGGLAGGCSGTPSWMRRPARIRAAARGRRGSRPLAGRRMSR